MLLYVEVLDDWTTTNKTNAASASAILEEQKNVVVKRDSVRKNEPPNIVFDIMLMLKNQLSVDNLCQLHLVIINRFVELPFFIKFLTGQVDKWTLEKYQTEVRKKSHESW
jgi:hypothetical protein